MYTFIGFDELGVIDDVAALTSNESEEPDVTTDLSWVIINLSELLCWPPVLFPPDWALKFVAEWFSSVVLVSIDAIP